MSSKRGLASDSIRPTGFVVLIGVILVVVELRLELLQA